MPTTTRLLLAVVVLASWRPAAAQTTLAFAKGADISWVTEMEASNYVFYNKAGQQQDLFQLLQSDYGMNTSRLRVWVNPPGGYNNAADVLAKALRAKALGLRLLIDFHYSDGFADPGRATPWPSSSRPCTTTRRRCSPCCATPIARPSGCRSATKPTAACSGPRAATCQLYAQSGGVAKNLALPTARTRTQISVPGIVVANGQCEIGLRSVANASNYCSLDDVELVLSSALATTPATAGPATAMQLFPNPTAGLLGLSYTLARPAAVQVALYTLTGQRVRLLAEAPALAAGPHSLALGSVAGRPAGIYLVQLTSEGTTRRQRLVVP